VRRRRNDHRGLALGAAGVAGSLLWLLWARVARRPVDSVAITVAVAASLIIVVNAVILQSGSRSAPFVANTPPSPAAAASRTPPPVHAAEMPRGPQTAAPPRNDPIGQLITTSSRIMKVQRVLSEYGYGQLRLTGVLDRPTGEAIERFEREHNLPVTDTISDRLMSELAVMAGHPLD
jgi:Putative peptidoglycan binding domain